MPELFQEMYYGPNVQNLVESDDCKVMRLSDNSGEGMMTLYHVFPGVFLMYNDFHMKECISGFQTDMDLLCIDHCREGRIEQEVGQNAFSYLEAGDLRVDRRIHHSGKVEFPLCHYHGISIGFQVETAAKEIPASMKGFSVDLYELQKNIAVTAHLMSFQENRPLSIFFPNFTMCRSKSKKTISRLRCWSYCCIWMHWNFQAIQKNAPIFIKVRLKNQSNPGAPNSGLNTELYIRGAFRAV